MEVPNVQMDNDKLSILYYFCKSEVGTKINAV